MTQQEYENKIKELEKQIEELKMAKIEEPQLKRWKPEYNNEYWMVEGTIYDICWYDNPIDNWNYLIGNCFKTKEEGEEYKKQIEYTARYKNYIEEHSEPIDWSNKNQLKYSTYYDLEDKEIRSEDTYNFITQGSIYASSEQIIWNAIKEIGEDNFKKYVLGVK